MIKVYSAQNAIDAHIVKGLLQQHGLTVRVDGEFLQGGIGELPPMGLVTVNVAKDDFDRALILVSEYEDSEA